jgi:hypothetical protein
MESMAQKILQEPQSSGNSVAAKAAPSLAGETQQKVMGI